jgi:hypothetical protein
MFFMARKLAGRWIDRIERMPARASRAAVWRPDWPFIRLQTALRLRPRRALSSAEAKTLCASAAPPLKQKSSASLIIPTLLAQPSLTLLAPRQRRVMVTEVRAAGVTDGLGRCKTGSVNCLSSLRLHPSGVRRSEGERSEPSAAEPRRGEDAPRAENWSRAGHLGFLLGCRQTHPTTKPHGPPNQS